MFAFTCIINIVIDIIYCNIVTILFVYTFYTVNYTFYTVCINTHSIKVHMTQNQNTKIFLEYKKGFATI